MFQDYFKLLFCLVILVLLVAIHQYITTTKVKKATFLQLSLVEKELAKEKMLSDSYTKKAKKINSLEKNTNRQLVIIKNKIVTLDFSFRELLETLV